MNVLILHYHLNPGGVSKIIEAQISSLLFTGCRITVLCGSADAKKSIAGAEIKTDSRLDYSESNVSFAVLREKTEALIQLIRGFIHGQTILHCHNINLGKNPSLTMAVYRLAAEGVSVINHCHDFPEDRPANLLLLQQTIPLMASDKLENVLYPVFSNYRFIVLTSCDFDRLINKNIAPSRIKLIPNPVITKNDTQKKNINDLRKGIFNILGFNLNKILCTYPVRSIERKNPGEFILFAAVFSDVAEFALTLPPRNPLELPQYNLWKNFCSQNGINVKFEAGELVNYEDLIFISDFCITTSKREGFGMVYIEPWMAGIPVIGRELPCVIKDLRDYGMIFPRLYNKIVIGNSGEERDFKDLKQIEQQGFISELLTNEQHRSSFFKNNPFLSNFFDDVAEETIAANQVTIKTRFSISNYGNELFRIYQEISK
jgi:glycosyltransferase involved in cell wall biosynthesis